MRKTSLRGPIRRNTFHGVTSRIRPKRRLILKVSTKTKKMIIVSLTAGDYVKKKRGIIMEQSKILIKPFGLPPMKQVPIPIGEWVGYNFGFSQPHPQELHQRGSAEAAVFHISE